MASSLFSALVVALAFLQLAAATCPSCVHGSCSPPATACTCPAGFAGIDCSLSEVALTSGVALNGISVLTGEWKYYHLTTTFVSTLYWDMMQSSSGDCDLYIQYNSIPSRTNYAYRDITIAQHAQINISNAAPGVWYAGVYGFQACTYSIKATSGSACPNSCSGHGTCGSNGACTCATGYSGNDCSYQTATLQFGVVQQGTAQNGAWNYYTFTGNAAWTAIDVVLRATNAGDPDLYVKQGYVAPTRYVFDYANVSSNAVSWVNITTVRSSVYTVGVYGWTSSTYTIQAISHVPTSGSTCQNQCSLHGACNSNQCSCTSGYTGSQCETYLPAIRLGTPYAGYAGDNAWNYYHVAISTSNSVQISITQSPNTPNGDCDLYIKQGSQPTRSSYDFLDLSDDPSYSVTIPQPGSGTWFIGLYGWTPCQYTLTITETTTCACAPGGHGTCSAGSTVCVCAAGWSGMGCNQHLTTLINGVNLVGYSVGMNEWAYFQINTTSTYFQVAIREATNTAGPNPTGNLWLFVTQTASYPTLISYDDADQTPNVPIHYADFAYNSPISYTYTIGVYGSVFINSQTTKINFQIVAWSPPQ